MSAADSKSYERGSADEANRVGNHQDYGTLPNSRPPSIHASSSASTDDGSRARPMLSWTHIYVLVAGCVLVFGNYYCYDLPAALNVPLRKLLGSSYSVFQWQLNLLYTIYSAPNILMPLIGGALYDRLGPRAMLLTFSGFVVLGALLFWIGLAFQSFPLLLVGRLLGGLGGESLEVAGTSITTTGSRMLVICHLRWASTFPHRALQQPCKTRSRHGL
ncbi:major facilitator superfamily domain-containing protein [Catenaria anguillulae PL171]|uniref:Lysosomal dipeptide transporter MFSD1 n=1 Tax=Catenaria anguillulae PL171 TaxID=765915 RepID=A0A1Y2HGL4_9FUNG|nr:major facilitator superfamily domain-containing protein [Catenaria anguillulae PL171]